MWRAFFLAMGVSLILLGVECFLVEQIEVPRWRGKGADNIGANGQFSFASFPTVVDQPKTRLVPIKDWVPWSLLAVGSVVLIYTFTIPRRRSEE